MGSITKKKTLTVLSSVLIVAVVLGLCLMAYSFFTKSLWFTAKPTDGFDKTPIFQIGDYPRVDASTATQPLAMAFMKNFTAESDIDQQSLNFTKTDQAYSKLINGDVDLILVTSPSEDELKRAESAGVSLEVIPVVNEGFVFFVNAKNPVGDLSIEQIQSIYQGDITNWQQVGGENKSIMAYQRPLNSGSQTGMIDLVMKDKQLMAAPEEEIAKTMSDIINIVSGFNGGSDAIGYSYYYYAKTMYQDIDAAVASQIKLLSVNGVKPDVESIKTGAYPFRTAYYIVINQNAAENSPAQRLKDAMLSDRGQAVALEADYVPVR